MLIVSIITVIPLPVFHRRSLFMRNIFPMSLSNRHRVNFDTSCRFTPSKIAFDVYPAFLKSCLLALRRFQLLTVFRTSECDRVLLREGFNKKKCFTVSTWRQIERAITLGLVSLAIYFTILAFSAILRS